MLLVHPVRVEGTKLVEMDTPEPELGLDPFIPAVKIQALVIEECYVALIERKALGDDVPYPTESAGRQRPGKGLRDHLYFPELTEQVLVRQELRVNQVNPGHASGQSVWDSMPAI